MAIKRPKTPSLMIILMPSNKLCFSKILITLFLGFVCALSLSQKSVSYELPDKNYIIVLDRDEKRISLNKKDICEFINNSDWSNGSFPSVDSDSDQNLDRTAVVEPWSDGSY
jgi:hypothetical protein